MARLALETGVKVIPPVAMVGTDKMNPIGSKMWRPAKITVRIGEPIDFSRFEGMGGNRFVERTVTDEVMYALMQLSGQEYVDIYAATVKNAAPTKTAATPKNAGAPKNAGEGGRRFRVEGADHSRRRPPPPRHPGGLKPAPGAGPDADHCRPNHRA